MAKWIFFCCFAILPRTFKFEIDINGNDVSAVIDAIVDPVKGAVTDLIEFFLESSSSPYITPIHSYVEPPTKSETSSTDGASKTTTKTSSKTSSFKSKTVRSTRTTLKSKTTPFIKSTTKFISTKRQTTPVLPLITEATTTIYPEIKTSPMTTQTEGPDAGTDSLPTTSIKNQLSEVSNAETSMATRSIASTKTKIKTTASTGTAKTKTIPEIPSEDPSAKIETTTRAKKTVEPDTETESFPTTTIRKISKTTKVETSAETAKPTTSLNTRSTASTKSKINTSASTAALSTTTRTKKTAEPDTETESIHTPTISKTTKEETSAEAPKSTTSLKSRKTTKSKNKSSSAIIRSTTRRKQVSKTTKFGRFSSPSENPGKLTSKKKITKDDKFVWPSKFPFSTWKNMPARPKVSDVPGLLKKVLTDMKSGFMEKKNYNCFGEKVKWFKMILIKFLEAMVECSIVDKELRDLLLRLVRALNKTTTSCKTNYGFIINFACIAKTIKSVTEFATVVKETVPKINMEYKFNYPCLKRHIYNIGCAILVIIGDIAYCTIRTVI